MSRQRFIMLWIGARGVDGALHVVRRRMLALFSILHRSQAAPADRARRGRRGQGWTDGHWPTWQQGGHGL